MSHNSALERIRAVPPQVSPIMRVEQTLSMAEYSTNLIQARSLELPVLGLQRAPLHVLVRRYAPVCKARGIQVHRFGLGEVPAGLLLEVDEGVYAAGPELCFVQMAREVSFLGAVVLGCELCGRYAHFSQMVSGYYERPTLTSVEKIADALDAIEGLYGLSKAREALRWIRDGARSPMETVMSCLLHLPKEHGGLAFAAPQLNYEVKLDAVAAAVAGTATCSIDAAHPEKRQGLEYDSKEFHPDLVRARRRREALQHMGWDIYTIDLDQMRNPVELVKTVRLLEDRVPRLDQGPVDADEVICLQRRLLHATRFGMGIEPALFGVPVAHGQVKLHL